MPLPGPRLLPSLGSSPPEDQELEYAQALKILEDRPNHPSSSQVDAMLTGVGAEDLLGEVVWELMAQTSMVMESLKAEGGSVNDDIAVGWLIWLIQLSLKVWFGMTQSN